MFKNFFIITIIISFGAFLYGIRHLFLEVEENACRMTYMFGVPQFSKINFDGNKQFPHYGLYYYYEGRLEKNANNLPLKGAPVIFVPGNAGSYKQVRSLASVALRKSMDNERNIQLDYFTISYEEQLSGLYGGYLENQKEFLLSSIKAVRSLYKKSCNSEKNVILIGHSMGGKVAEAVLEDSNIAAFINSIIFISTPINSPVVNFDSKMNQFYTYSSSYLSNKRTTFFVPNTETNVCSNYQHRIPQQGNESKILDNTLLISIGGGNRDLLVRDGLTTSKYSDIHAMTSSIPRVWLSCDHLSAVWCLQLVMVINRFLFSITKVDGNKNVFFVSEKSHRIQRAINYFVRPIHKYKSNEISFLKSNDDSSWNEDSKIVYRKIFKNGLRVEYNHMLPISKYKMYKKLYVEINNFNEINEWIYGCTANVTKRGNIKCDKGTSLSHHIQSISSFDQIRTMAIIDLQHIHKYYPHWTHVLIRLPPINKSVTLKIDVYKNKERTITIKTPRWFSFDEKIIVNETLYGSIYYEIFIEDMIEPFPTLQFNVKTISCNDQTYDVVSKICVPWARGFERYNHITHQTKDKSIYVNVPMSAPSNYNTTKNPVSLELFLDPVCRYKISYKFSIAGTMSKIVQEFYHWFPAHLTAVLFVVLRNQIVKFQSSENSLFIKPYAGYFQCKSLYIITGCRLLKKLLLPITFLPQINTTDYAFYVSIIIHSTAIVASIVFVFIIWTILTFHGNILYKIALRLTRISVASSNILMKIISTLPLTFGVLFISISIATCSGIALVLASVFYYILISNAYKDYLENWAWEKATGLFKKLRSKRSESVEVDSNDSVISAENSTPLTDTNEKEDSEDNYFQGLENFSFHITMLLLLVIMSCLNFGLSVAWIKSHYFGHREYLPDPSLIPAITVLCALSILLQLNAPYKSSGYHAVAAILYILACLCVIYCQDNLYRLNFLIAFAYVIIALQEIVRRLLCFFGF